MPAASSVAAVPLVAMMPKPSVTNSRASGMTLSLSMSLTLTKTFPLFGNGGGAAICDFA